MMTGMSITANTAFTAFCLPYGTYCGQQMSTHTEMRENHDCCGLFSIKDLISIMPLISDMGGIILILKYIPFFEIKIFF